ncbi:hypothetical protein HETIRDRAFT_322107 [Heterobasidion irregulare TC 32-1]|uniref:Uncharacterized protein n=1 Tax=Heterobasidion irregulare (strain TC 32-1) TaxID=747525 RepID=W4K2Y1_HETIT|nr:uncharacterized protein HETIRDRAFT_322107 [Heterobasidion irregulare TC 32-1]ETW79416.1 hypothetical protein HETIRDRAFT_322107 [Heterobasidion irregulare TC 32-1]
MPSLIPLDNLLGVAFVGVIISTAQVVHHIYLIYGVTCLQLYLYYTKHCQYDGRFVKLFVSFFLSTFMVLDTLNLIFLAHAMYYYMVTNFGDYQALVPNVW